MKIDTHIRSVGGGIKLTPQLRDQADRIIAFCDKNRGGFVHLVIEPPRKPRTTGEKSQSHHLNGHCQQIAEETGHEFSEIKTAVKEMAIKRGYPYKTIGDNVVPISEAASSTEECAQLIESAHELAAFLGVILNET